MHVLHGDAGCRRRRLRLELEFRLATSSTPAIERHAAVVGVIEIPRAAALVRIRHRATVRQAPCPGQRDRAIDAARTGRCRHHEASFLPVEMIRQLQQHAMRRTCAADARKRLILATRHIRYGAIHAAIASQRAEVGNAFPVALDRPSAQFRGGGIERIGERQRCAGQPGQPQAGTQQIILTAMLAHAHVAVINLTHGRTPRSRVAGTGRQHD